MKSLRFAFPALLAHVAFFAGLISATAAGQSLPSTRADFIAAVTDDEDFSAVEQWVDRDLFDALLPVHRSMLVRLAGRRADSSLHALERPVTCFDSDFDPEKIGAFERAIWGDRTILYQSGFRWTFTATDGTVLEEGMPLTVTYSFMPDGSEISGFNGEPAAPSDLFARFNTIYGSAAAWQAHFHAMFDRWEELTGITFVHEPNDDGVPLGFGSGNDGQPGVRGDIRIGGHFIDGNSGILAYNFFPNGGDMVIDSSDSFYTNTNNNSLRLRNTAAHEVGHGIGMPHNCPSDQTKLMEPFINLSFDGPQHDEIRGGQRRYGDRFEPNDTGVSAHQLGTLSESTLTIDEASIDHALGLDFFRITLDRSGSISVVMTPTGSTFNEAPQNSDGSCPAGTPTNSLIANDLGLQIRNSDNTAILASSTSAPGGSPESVNDLELAAGTYLVRVSGGSTDEVQTYDLSITTAYDAASPTPTPTPVPSAARQWTQYE